MEIEVGFGTTEQFRAPELDSLEAYCPGGQDALVLAFQLQDYLEKLLESQGSDSLQLVLWFRSLILFVS